MRAKKFTAPAHWASYLINGDASGLEPGEASRADEYVQNLFPRSIVSVVDCGEPFFSWSCDLYGGINAGGDLAEYTALTSRKPAFRKSSRSNPFAEVPRRSRKHRVAQLAERAGELGMMRS